MIALGLAWHEMSYIFIGAAYIFLGMGNLPFTHRRGENGPTWRACLASASIWVGLAAAAIPLLLIATGPNLATWLGFNANVTPSDLVRHPIIYNNQKIQTSGYVSASNGRCRLEVCDEAAPPTQRLRFFWAPIIVNCARRPAYSTLGPTFPALSRCSRSGRIGTSLTCCGGRALPWPTRRTKAILISVVPQHPAISSLRTALRAVRSDKV